MDTAGCCWSTALMTDDATFPSDKGPFPLIYSISEDDGMLYAHSQKTLFPTNATIENFN